MSRGQPEREVRAVETLMLPLSAAVEDAERKTSCPLLSTIMSDKATCVGG